ncbi:DUF6311 domain-containing protein [Plastoroseomonas hellenica]|uniref:DUF6311 domain-containing protein n=1 Tax=Plastoroseomonas hellenica TaxID=2687306 RepID=UPI001BA7B458|nr:DUF6311 domain-containing protein [Plastoroseomonas hellenica]MBR0646597.1 hypothetical protein [Plastoroseomonas hellenica]
MRAGAGQAARPAGTEGEVIRGWLRDHGWLPLLLGMAACLAAFGPKPLWPAHDLWLSGNPDHGMHWLGWLFFRDQPWAWPPSRNPAYGLELSSSIFFSDPIPLLAFAFKALHRVVPINQYFGLWVLACFLLQAVLAWQLLGRWIQPAASRAFGCLLLLFAPFFLWRIGLHLALVGQWVVLAALLIATRPRDARRHAWPWVLLLPAASLIHAYFLAMAATLWAADLFVRATDRPATVRPARLAVEAIAILALTAAALAFGGFALMPGGIAFGDGFGHYGMDLLGPVLPLPGWSFLLAPRLLPDQSEAGANFVGLGGLLLLAAATVAVATRPALLGGARRHWALGLGLLALLVLSWSNHVSIAGHPLAVLPIPDALRPAFDALRASARFAWPAVYAVVIAAMVLVHRRWHYAISHRILFLAAALQIADTAPGWLSNRMFFAQPQAAWPTALTDPFWDAAGIRYRVLRELPPNGQPDHPRWRDVMLLAQRHGMATDMVYLARVDRGAREAARAEARRRVARGDFAPDTLYILQPSVLGAVRASHDPERDLLAEIDGTLVLAPGWRRPFTAAAEPAP